MESIFPLALCPDRVFSRHSECPGGHGRIETNIYQRTNRLSQRCIVPVTLILVLLGLLWWTPLEAATYYVDFAGGSDSNAGTSTSAAWKRIKGMTGVTGAAASAPIAGGDTIIFKGGVTWASSYPWAVVGGSASMVTYTTDHSWFTGGSFTQPVFDNNGASTNYPTNAMVTKTGGGFVTFNDLKFYRCGPLGGPHDGTCMYFIDTSNMSVTNNTFDARAGRFVLYFNFLSSGTRSNFIVTGNDVQATGSFVWMASAAAGAVETNFVYTGNTIHDFASQLGCSGSCEGNHGDGFLHYFGSPNNDATQYLDGMTFCNNRAYGDFTRGIGTGTGEDMTGFFFVEGAVKNVLICNNDFALTPSANTVGTPAVFGDGAIFLRQQGNASAGPVWIINNSFGFDPAQQVGSAVITTESGWPGLTIKNNIISIGTNCAYNQGGSTPSGSLDYNVYRCPNAFVPMIMTDGGHSIAGTNTNPLWASQWTNLRLTALSPAIGQGQNLSSLGGLSAAQQTILNRDRTGVARGSSWDIGAYQSSTSIDTPPATPVGLRIIP